MATPEPPGSDTASQHALDSAGQSSSRQEIVDEVPLWKRPPVRLGITGLVSWWLYVGIVWLSRDFTYGTPGIGRPLLGVMSLFGGVFVLYLVQVGVALRQGKSDASTNTAKSDGMLPVIVVFAIAFRVLLLFSEPIQEVDAYRYLWDGQAVAAGVNPFRHSPHQVLDAETDSQLPADLRQLVQLRDEIPTRAEILRRVHFGELTTVYPPVSQAVFALAAGVTPGSADVPTHLLVMKCFIVAFDLATLWILVLLLRFVNRPPEWSIIYAWCPLVMKEFANSGHLDSIAVFITTASLYCTVRVLFAEESTSSLCKTSHFRGANDDTRWLLAASLLLGLGVGAKIYPAIFAPLLVLSIWRRFGFHVAAVGAVVFSTVSVAMVLPMLTRDQASPTPVVGPVLPPVPDQSPSGPEIDPTSTGLSAFAAQWQMNDFLFLLLFENLTPDRGPDSTRTAWFVLTPSGWRDWLVDSVSRTTGLVPQRVPFLITRVITIAIFGALALSWAWRAAGSTSANDWLMFAFLTVAWFWMLQPTQNPWYWTWALPLVPFARSRAWLLLSGLTLIYYLRFWCIYHAAESPLFGTRYAGVDFFDFVGSWMEFAPWLLVLGIEAYYRNASKASDNEGLVSSD
ncbi:MAG: hypothetical protein HQ518_15930 [Rhodopirellula sp.]|nr:hypothetical protein [Rhodopirellula sp.]